LVSGSNCCRPKQIHLFRRRADGSFAGRAELGFGERKLEERAVNLPHLVDWDRDGHTDLVVGYRGSWTLHVGLGPFANEKDLTLTPVELPPIQGAWPMRLSFSELKLPPVRSAAPVHFAFADWDGDGRVDLLVGVEWEGPPRYSPDGNYLWVPPGRCSVYWFRNASTKGPPQFAAAAHLLDLPKPWKLRALTAVDWGGDGRQSLVVSVSTGYKREEAGPVASELWLYRRKAEPLATPDRGGK
jgi:FG-GAP-like repeat